MAEETKFTLKIGLVASFVSALLIFVLSALWAHQTDITTLRTNQTHVLETLNKLDTVPTQLAGINAQLFYISQAQKDHKMVSETNMKMLKNGSK
jgi:hypothetical protein